MTSKPSHEAKPKRARDGDSAKDLAPDRVPLKKRQAERLAQLTGLSARELVDRPVAELADKLRWRIDPSIFLFRKVCGKVVRTDQVTGIDYPVPYATVHVMDTDCSFLGLFPVESPWAWLFPIFCNQEEIATTTTDACGEFCVWIPRFEIDWILRWRLERHCLLDLLIKPNLADLLKWLDDHLIEKRPPIGPPEPGPDPAPFLARDPDMVARVRSLVGPEVASRLHLAAQTSMLNLNETGMQAMLERPAFQNPIPPPLPKSLHELQGRFHDQGAQAMQAHIGGAERDYRIDLKRYVGPFLRPLCWYELKVDTVPLLDVPDITFTVTQDVDGDGTEETIYSEGFFDVRWNAGNIPPVTLHASQIAVASPICGDLPEIDCQESGVGAGIRGVSLVQLDPPTDSYISSTSGYAVRPNRPHTDGLVHGAAFSLADPAATAPLHGTLLLRGCNQIPGAAYYRVLYSHDGEPEVPFLNLTWPTFRPLNATPVVVSPVDASGWYNVLPDPGNWLVPYLLLAWKSYEFQAGVYTLRVELADGGKNHLAYSDPVVLNIDNSAPAARINSLEWRQVGASSWTPLPLACPVVRRPLGADIEFRVSWQGSAMHLLYSQLLAGGCGSSTATLALQTGATSAEHWYTGELDNAASGTAIYRLNFPGGGQPDNQGAYSFWVNAYSRAIDPSHATGYTLDWNYNVVWIGGTLASVQVAVVNL
jgi:hypothetical protein